ncbi:hypothetical protein [Streptomyces sp. Tue6028]|uniref:hypothetical protein n=1 Tax=Streptomyces sp. Tue6028 TaxID=2036037 RepID=UPI003D74A77F
MELDKRAAGILRAEVVRADGRHTETLPLGNPADEVPAGDSWRVCAQRPAAKSRRQQ